MITTIFFIIPKIIRQTFKENWINIQKTISAIRNKFWAVWYYYSIFFLTKKRETKSIMNLVNLFYSLDYCKKKFVSLVQKVLTKKKQPEKKSFILVYDLIAAVLLSQLCIARWRCNSGHELTFWKIYLKLCKFSVTFVLKLVVFSYTEILIQN